MKLNASLWRKKKVAYGTVAQIDGIAQWTDEQVLDLAFQAHKASREAHEDYKRKKQYKSLGDNSLPAVTTTLVLDNTAYIYTSMKGGPYLYSPGYREDYKAGRPVALRPDHPCEPFSGEVFTALRRCQLQAADNAGANVKPRAHRTGASCGA